MEYDNVIRLTNNEIFNCLKLYKEGRVEYYDKIVVASIPFIRRLIYNCFGYTIEKRKSLNYDDLVEVGITGIMLAIDNYDLSRKTNFYNYASYYVRSEVKRYIKQERINIVSLDELNEKLSERGKGLMSNFDLENNYLKKEILVVLQDVLNTLDLDTKNMILDYFGFSGAKLNLHDISSKYNISYANASRIIRMTLYKLRLKMNNNGYYDRIK